MQFVAFERAKQGTGASRRLRNTGRAPGIVFGGTAPAVTIELDHNALWHALKKEAFHSSILDMELAGRQERQVSGQPHRHRDRDRVPGHPAARAHHHRSEQGRKRRHHPHRRHPAAQGHQAGDPWPHQHHRGHRGGAGRGSGGRSGRRSGRRQEEKEEVIGCVPARRRNPSLRSRRPARAGLCFG